MGFSSAIGFLLLVSSTPAVVKASCDHICECGKVDQACATASNYNDQCVVGGFQYNMCKDCQCCSDSTATEAHCGSVPSVPAAPAAAPSGGVNADPHMTSLGGGKFDFRGEEDTYFALWAALYLQVNGMTEERLFKKKGGQIVAGSYFTRVAFKVAVEGNMIVHAQILAEQPGSFRLFGSNTTTGLYANRTSVELPGVSLTITSHNELVVRAHDLVTRVKWGQVRTPLNVAGQPVPEIDSSRFYLDTSFSALDSTMPAVAPHGLIGQSFDGSKLTVHGKRDNYGRARLFKTSAQGEGAIEGTYKDYIVANAFATSFKFSRFGVQGSVAPRNIDALTGFKEPKVIGGAAGSVEDDANME